MDSYQFTPTQDWFSAHIDTWTALFPLVQSKQPRALEIGSCEGRSAVFLLNTLCKDDGEITCIDHFDLLKTEVGRQRFDRVNHNLALTGKQSRVLSQYSVPALMTLLEEEITSKKPGFDWIYVDGSHEADDTMLDGELAWRMARKGAIIIFDDYHWDWEQEDSIHHPKRGIDAFLTLHAGEYERLTREDHYQVVLRKLTDMRIGFLVGGTDDRKLLNDTLEYGINIALCFDSSFAMAGAVAIRSIVETTPECLTIYIVDCGILPEDKERLKQTINGYDHATLVFLLFSNDSISKGMGPAWARLDMIEFLPVERVLYLDADILVRKSLKPLWEVDLGGKCMAAARDVGFPMGLDESNRSPYFNAGVLLIDIAKARLDIKELKRLAPQMKNARFKDQDLMNAYYINQGLASLSLKWNAQGLGTYAGNPSDDGDMTDPSVVHFTGAVHPSMVEVMDPKFKFPIGKPWGYMGSPGHPYESDWWAVLERTAWKGIRSLDSWGVAKENVVTYQIAIATDEFKKLVAAK